MGLREIESSLPPGFRFHPNDEELVCYYLYQKITNERALQGTMVDVDLHTREPWELPEVAKLSPNEWYFFSFRDRKYTTGSRANRATRSGYWKATGKDKIICEPGTHNVVGMRKTLVFYRGRAPNGIKTSWVMHEFRLENPNSPPKEDWVLCRVFHKSKGKHDNNNMDSSSLTLRSSPDFHGDQPMPNECTNEQLMSSSQTLISNDITLQEGNSNSMLNVALLQCNLLDLSQDMESTPMMGVMSSRGFGEDDEFGFFYDMGIGEVQGHDMMCQGGDKFYYF